MKISMVALIDEERFTKIDTIYLLKDGKMQINYANGKTVKYRFIREEW